MHIQDHSKVQTTQFSLGHQLFLLVGFVFFITGVFSFTYALLASYLLPFSKSILLIALSGLIGAYIGRKILRRNRKQITL